MTELRIYTDKPAPGAIAKPEAVVTDAAEIRKRLNEIDVLYERWETADHLDKEASQDEIIEAYRKPIDHLMQRYGFESLDVINMYPDHPKKDELRDKFLHEHIHNDFEVRFFVDGQALFYIRTNGKVYGVLCTRGDLISVPANVTHWFDMGDEPHFKAIRLFLSNEGWTPKFTGDPIAERFPLLDHASVAQGS